VKRRASYQNGFLELKPRKRGPDVWVFRYRDSEGITKSEPIGTVDKYPTRAAALKVAKKKRDEINDRVACITIAGLCDRYLAEAMPKRGDTAASYRSYLKRIRNDWGKVRVDVMAKDIMGMEHWIDQLQTIPMPNRPARPVAKKTRTHMKWLLHRLLELAIKWGHLSLQRNPVVLVEVKGRSRKTRVRNLITIDQWHQLMADEELLPHVRTMIFIAMLLGLRASEILGLREEDIDFARRTLNISRSHVGKDTDDTKTERSEQELPIHDDLVEVFKDWLKLNTYHDGSSLLVNGWLFGNLQTGRPFWRDSLQVKHLVPAGRRVGIPNLGWYDFRHTYRAMMREIKISLEEQRDLMRHEDIRTTLGYGGKTQAETIRGANAKVVEMLRKKA